jgi:hypothetical protein
LIFPDAIYDDNIFHFMQKAAVKTSRMNVNIFYEMVRKLTKNGQKIVAKAQITHPPLGYVPQIFPTPPDMCIYF